MGILFDLSFDSGASEHFGMGRSFFKEIISGHSEWFNIDYVLAKEEQRVLYPDYDSGQEERVFSQREPYELKAALVKVYNFLRQNEQRLPLIHWIRGTGGESNTSEHFLYDGYESYLNGFHHNLAHRDELELCSLHEGIVQRTWIKVSETVTVDGQKFHVRSETKFQQYREFLEDLMRVCDEAVTAGKKVEWSFSN